MEQLPADRDHGPRAKRRVGRQRGRFDPFADDRGVPPFPAGFGARMRGLRGRRVPRGNVRAATLLLLEEQPRNGYQVMQEIAERSKGVWRPSPGSVYPALQQLEDEGLVRFQETDGQRLFTLTDAGATFTDEHRAEFGSPWEEVSGAVGDDIHELLALLRQTAIAATQVSRAGSALQVRRAIQLMKETRRNLYRILAEDDSDMDSSESSKPPTADSDAH